MADRTETLLSDCESGHPVARPPSSPTVGSGRGTSPARGRDDRNRGPCTPTEPQVGAGAGLAAARRVWPTDSSAAHTRRHCRFAQPFRALGGGPCPQRMPRTRGGPASAHTHGCPGRRSSCSAGWTGSRSGPTSATRRRRAGASIARLVRQDRPGALCRCAADACSARRRGPERGAACRSRRRSTSRGNRRLGLGLRADRDGATSARNGPGTTRADIAAGRSLPLSRRLPSRS